MSGGLLSKERIIAEPGFNRNWMPAFAGMTALGGAARAALLVHWS